MSQPLVSICCLTYNHEKYIRECLDGFLMQKTNFKFEILIHDDASTDNTANIIRKYEQKYPEIIKPIYQNENQYSQGVKPSVVYNFPRAKGKYIAMCEGDDYWIDSLKLQKQCDVLEKQKNISLVFSNRVIFDHKKNIKKKHILSPEKNVFRLKDVIGGFIPSTQTMLFRNDVNLISFMQKHSKHPSGDQLIALFYAIKGDFFLLDDLTALYRITGHGAWSSRSNNQEYSFKLFLIGFKQILINENVYNSFYFNAGMGRKLLRFKSVMEIYKLKIGKSLIYKLYCISIFKIKRIVEIIYQSK